MPRSFPIPYREYRTAPSGAFPEGRLVRRPVVSLAVEHGRNRLSCNALVDSGADHCLFPRSFMQPLGLDPLHAPVEMTAGVGNTRVPTHYAEVILDLHGVIRFSVYAGFTTGMDQLGIGLLGQAGFFEAFRITFDYANKIYYLEER